MEPAENVELEAQLVEVKAVLKAQKLRVTEMMEELEAKGRDLCRRKQIFNCVMLTANTDRMRWI